MKISLRRQSRLEKAERSPGVTNGEDAAHYSDRSCPAQLPRTAMAAERGSDPCITRPCVHRSSPHTGLQENKSQSPHA